MNCRRPALLVSLTALVATYCGCSHVPEGNERVTGQFTFIDGSELTGVVGVVRFDPEEMYEEGATRGASVGSIKSDGSFELMTHAPGDGVPLGDYRVVLAIQGADGNPAKHVHYDYRHFETTPWKVSVKSDGDNHFELKLDPAEKRPLNIDPSLPGHEW